MGISAAEMQRRIQKISPSMLAQEVTKLVLRDETQALKRAKINEFEFGLRPNYRKIGYYQNDDYAQYKLNKGSLAGYGYVNLIDTGAFSNSMFVVRKTNSFIFDSGNSKAGDLIEKYGMDIMGLNQKTFNRIQRELYAKHIIIFIKNKLGQ